MKHLARVPVRVRARRSFVAVLAAMVLLTMSGSAARAGSYLFNFNSSSLYNSSTTTAGPPTTDNSAAISAYMDTLLPAGSGVTVAGAASSGSPTNPGYAGEGYVVCTSGGSGSGCTPDTLATKYQTPFLVTDGSVQVGGNNAITMAFTGNIEVSSLTFDFEIFPNASCPNGNTCNPQPDFNFKMTTGSSTVENCTVFGVLPGSALTTTAPACATGAISSFSGGPSASTNTSSPNGTPQLASQYLGTMTFNFTTPVTNPTLSFIDWPATIGVTNIQLTTVPVPEPSSLFMLVSGLIGLGIILRRGNQAA